MSQKKLNPNLLQGIEGTLLGEVFCTTEKEITTFLKKSDIVTKKDKKVGEILPLEAALILHAVVLQKTSEKLKADFNTDANRQMKQVRQTNSNKILPSKKVTKLIHKFKQLSSESEKLIAQSKLLSNLAWNTVYGRLGNIKNFEKLKLCKDGIIIDATEID